MGEGLLYLILNIVLSSILVLLFKAFERYKVNVFQTIVINYLVCILTGFIATGSSPFTTDFWNAPWFLYGILLGFCFIIGFNLVATCIRIFGVTIGAVVQKMSLILSVSFAIIYFNESVNTVKIIGLILALAAIILANYPSKNESQKIQSTRENYKKYGYLLGLVLLTSGLIEVVMNYVEIEVASQKDDASFITFAFGMGFILGTIYWLWQRGQGKQALERKSIYAGLILGIPNFFSLYFIMLALGAKGWEASVVFPISNVGMIGVSALGAILIFKEKLSKTNALGVIIAMLSILIIAWS